MKNNPPSIQTKLIVVTALIVAVSFAITFVTVLLVLERSLIQRDRKEIEDEIEELVFNYEMGGLKAVRFRIEANNVLGRDRPFMVRVATAENKTILASTPRQWDIFDVESLTAKNSEGELIILDSPYANYQLEVLTMPTSDGPIFQVGASTGVRRHVLNTAAKTFAFVAVPLVVLIVGVVVLNTRRALVAITEINETVLRLVEHSKYDESVPKRGASRETDELVDRFNTYTRRVAELVRHLRSTVRSLAHDIRTPLARIRMTAEMALAGPETDANALRDALVDIIDESSGVTALLGSFLDAAEADSGTLRLNLEPVNIRRIVGSVTAAYAMVGAEKNVSVEHRHVGGGPVLADPTRLRQAVGNILDNAVKYSPSGRKVEVFSQVDDSGVLILVRDFGPGFSSGDLDHAWDFQYRGRFSDGTPGYGIGLTVVRAVALAHGGTASIDQPASGGASVSIRLPATTIVTRT